MFGLRMHVRFHSGRVRRAAHRGSVRSLGHAGARLRLIARPSHEIAGPVGMAHEFGGEFRGDEYPPRPFMGPALEKVKPGLPRFWSGSVR